MTEQHVPSTPGSPLPTGVVPYVDHHVGPRRVLVLNLTSGNDLMKGKTPPVVGIDGRQYIVYWGAVSFEIPADRSCHLSVHVEGSVIAQVASALLPPGGPLTLTYRTDYLSGRGSLG